MTGFLLELVAMLFIILAASEHFTNSLEHLGEKFHISDGACILNPGPSDALDE
jgi:hypothetical protein